MGQIVIFESFSGFSGWGGISYSLRGNRDFPTEPNNTDLHELHHDLTEASCGKVGPRKALPESSTGRALPKGPFFRTEMLRR